jgi:hypothetical protein
VIYSDDNQQNSRHTFQSWRDRWIKYVQFHARPSDPDISETSDDPVKTNTKNAKATKSVTHRSQISSESESPEIVRHIPPSTSRSVAAKPSAEPVSSIKSKGTKVPESSQANPWVAKSSGGIKFTEKEIDLLMDEYDAIVNIDEDRAIDAWAAWAVIVS